MTPSNIQAALFDALSSVDKDMLATLEERARNTLFLRLIFRISALLAPHGAEAVREFTECFKDSDPCKLFNKVLRIVETGSCSKHDNDYVVAGELQEELRHFSRIVDTDVLFKAGAKRLARSRRIPDELKTLIELTTVVRSRMIQRSLLEAPRFLVQCALASRVDFTEFSIFYFSGMEWFLLAVGDESPRQRHRFAFLVQSCLPYLQTHELTTILAGYMNGGAIRRPRWFTIVGCTAIDEVTLSHWHIRSQTNQPELLSPEISQSLPRYQRVDPSRQAVSQDVWPASPRPMIDFHHQSLAIGDQVFGIVPSLQPDTRVDWNAQVQSLKSRLPLPIVSIECAHIHMDRRLDIDQITGAQVGRNLIEYINASQSKALFVAPMLDDDHVTIRLRPFDYMKFFVHHTGVTNAELIPESSPVVRSVVVALFHRLKQRFPAESFVKLGSNLYFRHGRWSCELFEDYSGHCANGCVLFEAALLIYRTCKKALSIVFENRFHEPDPHRKIGEIIDAGADDADIRMKLSEYYKLFTSVTRPDVPDSEIGRVIETELAQNGRTTHLNVLEDYYESQQNKVRKLLSLAELPIRLITVHYNALSGFLRIGGE